MVTGNTRAIILAAGRSKRFRRKQSKLLSKICGRSMVLFPLRALEKLGIPTTVVLGYQADQIKEEITHSWSGEVSSIIQEEFLGTGHAVLCAKKLWDQEDILILNADVPLLTPEFIKNLLQQHRDTNAVLSFVSTHLENPFGYGRIIEQNGRTQIYEEKNCPAEFKDINQVNAGIYVIKKSFLEDNMDKVEKNSVSGEFYLTDLVELASEQGLPINIVPAPFDVVRGVNTLQELWAVEQVMRSHLIKHWMNYGVRFELAQSIHIDIDVEIGPDSYIGTGVHLLGKTEVGQGCFIGAFSIIEDTLIKEETKIHSHSVIQESIIGKQVEIGPFARLRSNVSIGNNAVVGNFVEVKNSTVGPNSKMKHLAYVGDATLGKNVNIGAGTIVCNYDGVTKQKTVIKENVFVGSNNTLVAPLTIEKDAYLAAGSTITKDVASNDLAIARARQENKKDYAKKLKKKDDSSDINFFGAIRTYDETELSG